MRVCVCACMRACVYIYNYALSQRAVKRVCVCFVSKGHPFALAMSDAGRSL